MYAYLHALMFGHTAFGERQKFWHGEQGFVWTSRKGLLQDLRHDWRCEYTRCQGMKAETVSEHTDAICPLIWVRRWLYTYNYRRASLNYVKRAFGHPRTSRISVRFALDLYPRLQLPKNILTLLCRSSLDHDTAMWRI